jgi:hypothetical protein
MEISELQLKPSMRTVSWGLEGPEKPMRRAMKRARPKMLSYKFCSQMKLGNIRFAFSSSSRQRTDKFHACHYKIIKAANGVSISL